MEQKPKQFAQYKGRKYEVLFLGETRHGKRALLSFLDMSKKFWVDPTLIKPLSGDEHEEETEAAEETMPFGKYHGQPFSEIPTDYLEWLIKRDNLREPLRTNVSKELSGRDDRSEEIDDSDIPF